MSSIGMTSRGENEEYMRLVGNYLHAEDHLTDVIKETKDEDDLEQLKDVVKTRQGLVKIWSNNRADVKYWCPSKHSLKYYIHLEECLSNAVRKGDFNTAKKLSEELKKAGQQRNKIVEKFLSGSDSNGSCERCELDFNDLMKIIEGNPKAVEKDLNVNKDNHDSTHTFYKNNQGEKMVSMREAGIMTGSLMGSEALKRLGYGYIDDVTGTAVQPIHFKASTWVSILGGIGSIYYATKKLSGEKQLALASFGAGLLSDLVRIAQQEAIAGGVVYPGVPGLRRVAPRMIAPTRAPVVGEELVTVD